MRERHGRGERRGARPGPGARVVACLLVALAPSAGCGSELSRAGSEQAPAAAQAGSPTDARRAASGASAVPKDSPAGAAAGASDVPKDSPGQGAAAGGSAVSKDSPASAAVGASDVPKDSPGAGAAVVASAVPKDSPGQGAAGGASAVPGDRFTTPVAGGAEFPTAPPPAPCGAAPAGMACVPAGPFVRGSDDGPENTRPRARVWLQTFYMDVNEVTYAEYRACMKARKCPPSGPGYTDFSRPRQPINGVDWFAAEAYCKAQGKRLPSEAQWEKAARGPDGALHPWGDEPATCARAIIKDERGRSCGEKKLYDKPATGRPFEVGSRPPGHYGLYDMSGNSWEWVADWYTRSYAECGAACAGVEPRGPCDGAATCDKLAKNPRKLVRGGSWYWDASYATAIYRRPHHPDNQPFHHFGFRCAASLEEAERLQKPPAPAG